MKTTRLSLVFAALAFAATAAFSATAAAPAKSTQSAAEPLSYAQLGVAIRNANGGKMNTDETIIKKITGKVVKLKLIKFDGGEPGQDGKEMFFVRKGEDEYFNCMTSSPGFKGGIVTATISKVSFDGENMRVDLDRCGS